MEIGVSNYQWALGDALIEECGPPGKRGISDGSYERLAKAVEYLCANGVEHNDRTLRTLREYREVSYLYPNGTRVPSVSFSVHRVLDGPDWMTRILADLPAGEKLTVIKATEMADAIRAAQGNNVVPLRQPEVAVS